MHNLFVDPFHYIHIPFGDWAQLFVQWVVSDFRDLFQQIKQPIQVILGAIQTGLGTTPPLIIILFLTLTCWQVATGQAAVLIAICLILIGAIGAWPEAMDTLSIVLTAITLCCALGIPIGMVAALSKSFDRCLRYALDFMQSIPSFVYLVPVVMLFGIGNVPGVLVTMIYSISPVIRLTSLGIRQVRPDVIEAARAFGSPTSKILFKVQIPLAVPTIMAGVNQTVMLALSMAVVGAMISVAGLGQMVLRGIGQLDVSTAITGGLGIVLLAIVIDRISQGLGLSFRQCGMRRWYERGPIGLGYMLFREIRSIAKIDSYKASSRESL
jgi:glycine betaine/proline transport system permease protein